MNKEYKCECEKLFYNPQSFNGHKSHCKIHQLSKYNNLDKYNKHIKKCIEVRKQGYKKYINILNNKNKQKLQKWISEQHKCEKCGKIMTEKFGSGRFCSRKCANSRVHTKEFNLNISLKMKGKCTTNCILLKEQNREKYYLNPKKCIVCGNIITYEKRKCKTCSRECLLKKQSMCGRKAILKVGKRSLNEISFCELCENYFGKDKVLHNKPIFNGWDADIILKDYKLAILWNGPWHYRKITKKHSLLQVQNRDKIKLNEIQKCGYIPYIIKDDKNDKNIIDEEFNKLLKFLNLLPLQP